MDRNSTRALALAAETGSTARQLERWSQEGLMPRHGQADALALYARALVDVAAQGRDYDRVALALASRHDLGCPRLPQAILRFLAFDDETETLTAPVEVDARGETTDAGFAELEDRATLVEETSPGAGTPGAEMVNGILRRFNAAPDQLGETAEVARHGFMTAALNMVAGDGLTPTAPLALAAGVADAGYVEDDEASGVRFGGERGVDFEKVLGTVRLDPETVRKYVETTSPDELAAGASRLRRTLALMEPLIGRLLGSADDLDILAPVMSCMLGPTNRDGVSPLVASFLGENGAALAGTVVPEAGVEAPDEAAGAR